MNTFISDKMGEVMAFAVIGSDTMKKGKKAFRKMLNQADIDTMENIFDGLEEKIFTIAAEQDVVKEVEKQAKETGKKVTKMRDTYIGRNWDEESELLEWMGFYTGASLVHWKLISGAAKELGIKDLEKLSKQAIDFYNALFVSDEKTLREIGAANVK